MRIFQSHRGCWANLWSRNAKSLQISEITITTTNHPLLPAHPRSIRLTSILIMPPLPASLQVPSAADDTITTRKRGTSSARVPSNPKMEEFLKSWRQDALNKHQYDAAIFIGDKLMALTGTPLHSPHALPKLAYRIQVTPKMHSGSPKYILAQAITTEPKVSLLAMTSFLAPLLVGTLQLYV